MSLSADFGGDVELLAAFNQEDAFIGLLAMSDAGAFVRTDGEWRALETNNALFIGSNVVTVSEEFLSIFDTLDAKGNEPTSKQALSYRVEEDDAEPEVTE